MKFNHLLSSIQQTHNALQAQTVAAINRSLTIRNWLIGFYIVEFEQKGEDRAGYGERLLKELARQLSIKGISETSLRLSRQFYTTYPQIYQTVSDELKNFGIGKMPNQCIAIRGTLSPNFRKPNLR